MRIEIEHRNENAQSIHNHYITDEERQHLTL